jgi:uncharacterized membrane protein YjfL (UPF0719 family)
MNWQNIIFVSVATIVLLAIARVVNQLIMRTSMTDSLIQRDNPAVGIEIAGYLLGVILIITSILSGPGHENLWSNVLWVGIYGIGGILLLTLVTVPSIQIILSADAMTSIKNGNVAAGIVVAGSYIGTAAVISGSFAGEGTGNIVSAIIFYAVGQISFLVITFIFRLLTAYDDSKEVMNGNVPAALSYAGNMISVGLIVGNAVLGNFLDYQTSLISFGKALLVVLALYPIRQWVVQGIFLGGGFKIYGGRLDMEISKDRNLNAGLLEATTYIATAILVTRLV